MNITFETSLVYDDILIFPSRYDDSLYEFSYKTQECNEIRTFTTGVSVNNPLYGSIQEYKGQYFLAPLFGECILVYDTINNITKKITLDNIPHCGDAFFESFIDENILYMVPGTYDAIVELNLDNYEILYHKDVIADIRKTINGKLVRHGITFVGRRAYLAIIKTNIILEIDCQTKRISLLKANGYDWHFTSVCDSLNDDCINVLCDNGDVIEFNTSKKEWKVLFYNKFESTNPDTEYYEIVQKDENLWIFPRWGNTILCFDTYKQKVYLITQGYPLDIVCVKKIKDFIILSDKDNDRIITLSVKDKKIINNIKFNKQGDKILSESLLEKDTNLYIEDEINSLPQFLKNIVRY